jgi:hypothetical protein
VYDINYCKPGFVEDIGNMNFGLGNINLKNVISITIGEILIHATPISNG